MSKLSNTATEQEVLAVYEEYKLRAKDIIQKIIDLGAEPDEIATHRHTYVQVTVAVDDVKKTGNLEVLRAAVNVLEKYMAVMEQALTKKMLDVSGKASLEASQGWVSIAGERMAVMPTLNREPDLNRGRGVVIKPVQGIGTGAILKDFEGEVINGNLIISDEARAQADDILADTPFFNRNKNQNKE